MEKSTSLFIRQAQIHTEEDILPNASLLIENGIIKEIFAEGQAPPDLSDEVQVINGEKLHVIPGFIDGHIHGADGADVRDSTPDA